MKRAILSIAALAVVVVVAGNTADSATRKILAEMFTSTTCSPCYAADNYYFNQWLPTYGGRDQIITIAYHVWWPSPGNDPMYLANPNPVQTRNTYYQASGGYAPRMFIDGFIDGTSTYTSWPGAIEGRFLYSSPISITLSGTRNGNTLDMNAEIHAEVAVNSTNWRVHWLVLESEIDEPQNSPNGYVPFTHHWVHRTMLPSADGSSITISQGQTVNIPLSITLNSAWNADHCKVVVFVQDNSDKKVQNAEVINVDEITGVDDGKESVPTEFSLAQNFPNPFNPSTTIRYAVAEKSAVTLRIFNTLGEEIRTLVSDSRERGVYEVAWDGRADNGKEVPSGLYFYQLTAGNFTATQKMLFVK